MTMKLRIPLALIGKHMLADTRTGEDLRVSTAWRKHV